MGILSKRTDRDNTIPGMDAQKTNMLAIGGIGSVLVLLIIIGAAFFLFYSTSQSSGSLNIPNTTVINNQSDGLGCDEACLFEKIKIEGELNRCDELNATRSDCLLYFGYLDSATCKRISERNVLKACIMHHALKEANMDICNSLEGDDKSTCITAVDGCYFKTGDERAVCYAIQKRDYNYCSLSIDCMYEYARETRDDTGCAIMGDGIQVLTCQSLATGQDKCRDAANPSQRDYCYATLAQETQNRAYCNSIDDTSSIPAEQCYSFFAIKELKPQYCDDVDIIENFRWMCLTDYSIETGEVAGCDMIDEYATVSKTNCYLKLAKEINDPRICEYLEVSPKYQCYVANMNIRTDLLTKEKCDGVASEAWRNRCYLEAGKNANDSTICNAITTESEQEFCIGIVEQKLHDAESE